MNVRTPICSDCRESMELPPVRGKKLLRCMAEAAGPWKGRTVLCYGEAWDKPPGSPAPVWCPKRGKPSSAFGDRSLLRKGDKN